MKDYILDKKRKELLPWLSGFKNRFYLAGGTALALQIGHRRSVDFDFFTNEEFDPNQLLQEIEKKAQEMSIKEVQNEKNTLSILVDEIKISFFYTPYKLLKEEVEAEYLRLASVIDIGAFKMAAILSRATSKDYFDLYYILQKVSLAELIRATKEKMPSIDENLMLKSLVYFDDVEEEEVNLVDQDEVQFDQVKIFLREKVRELV